MSAKPPNYEHIDELINFEDIDETEELMKGAVTLMREWISNQPHFINCRQDTNFLLRFLRLRKYHVNLAQQSLDKYLTARTKFPQFYQNLDIREPSLRDLISRGYIFPLLEKDKEGRTVLFSIAGALDATRHKQTDIYKAFLLTFEALMEDEENQKKGLVYIFTQEGYQINHALMVGLRDLQSMIRSGEKALPLRHKQMHWLNVPVYLATLFQLLKTFLSEKLQQRIKLHIESKTLFEFFPASMLPKEYGGEVPVNEMTAQWIEVLEEKRRNILALDKMSIKESVRPKDRTPTYNVRNLENHFNSLEFD